ncbi:hypothetical protein D3C81_2253470 [compost metagenome]
MQDGRRENRQYAEQFGVVQVQALAADDHEQAGKPDGDAEHLGGIDFFPQEQRREHQDKHWHAAEQECREP